MDAPLTSFPPGYCDRNPVTTAMLVLSAIMIAIAFVIVPLRVYVRTVLVKSFWYDDISLLISFLLLIPLMGIVWHATALGYGKRIGCFPPENILTLGRLINIVPTLLSFTTVFARISVALFVIRLFAITRALRRALYGYIFFMTAIIVTTAALQWVQCSPIEAVWNPEVAKTASCWSPTVRTFIGEFNGAVATFSDLFLAVLPGYFLYKVQMKRSTKLGISLLMAVGLFPAIFTLLRTILTTQLNIADPFYDSGVLTFFGVLEPPFLIVAAAIPAIRPLFNKSLSSRRPTYYYNKSLLPSSWRRPSASSELTSTDKEPRVHVESLNSQ